MAEKYYSILTNRGKELEAAAAANGTSIIIKDFVAGDGSGRAVTPDPAKTKLVNEVYRAAISSLNVSPEQASQFIAHLVIPADVGGFTVREVGLLTDAGELYAVANCASIEKPVSGISINLQFRLAVSETSNIELKVATGDGLFLRQDANLKDVKDKKESRENLGLGELAAMVGEANKLPYFNEEGLAHLADVTEFSRDILAQADAFSVLTKLGIIALGVGSTGMETVANVDWQQVDMVSGSIAIWNCSNWINAPDGLPKTSLVVAEVTGRSGTRATVNITAFNASSNRRIWSVSVESVHMPGSRTFNVLEIMTSGNPTPISAGGTGASTVSGALENLGLGNAINALLKANNLSDLQDKTLARVNLGVPKGVDKQMCNEWVVFSGVNTVVIGDSIGISSITRTGVGQYTVNLTSPYATINYAIDGRWTSSNVERNHELAVRNKTTNSFQLYCATDSDNLYPPNDAIELSLSIRGVK